MLESAKLSKCLKQLTTVRNALVSFSVSEQLLLSVHMVPTGLQCPSGSLRVP